MNDRSAKTCTTLLTASGNISTPSVETAAATATTGVLNIGNGAR